MNIPRQAGFTLIELLVAIGLIAILGGIAIGNFGNMQRGWQLKDATQQVLEATRRVQSQAMQSGDYASSDVPGGGRQFRQQAMFLVFDTDARSYTAWQWIDSNNNGYPDAKTVDDYTNLFSENLPGGVNFGSGPATKIACSGSSTISQVLMTFDSPSYYPCENAPCIRFTAKGSIADKGNIYLTNARETWAINSLEPGFFRACRWNGNSWTD